MARQYDERAGIVLCKLGASLHDFGDVEIVGRFLDDIAKNPLHRKKLGDARLVAHFEKEFPDFLLKYDDQRQQSYTRYFVHDGTEQAHIQQPYYQVHHVYHKYRDEYVDSLGAVQLGIYDIHQVGTQQYVNQVYKPKIKNTHYLNLKSL
jgi:hypothetical protein